jgi:hypothetical protein
MEVNRGSRIGSRPMAPGPRVQAADGRRTIREASIGATQTAPFLILGLGLVLRRPSAGRASKDEPVDRPLGLKRETPPVRPTALRLDARCRLFAGGKG